MYNEFRSTHDFSPYKESLLALSPKVKYTFGIWDFRLTATDFCQVLETFAGVKHLDLYRNKFINFDTEEIKLDKDKEYSIEGIDLRWTQGLSAKNIIKLVKALSENESLVNSLQYVWINGTRMSVPEMQLLFTKYNFTVTI